MHTYHVVRHVDLSTAAHHERQRPDSQTVEGKRGTHDFVHTQVPGDAAEHVRLDLAQIVFGHEELDHLSNGVARGLTDIWRRRIVRVESANVKCAKTQEIGGWTE